MNLGTGTNAGREGAGNGGVMIEEENVGGVKIASGTSPVPEPEPGTATLVTGTALWNRSPTRRGTCRASSW
jgi:hypothetical protein